MTIKQGILKLAYPLLMMINKIGGSVKKIKLNDKNVNPPVSFYSLKAKDINGELFEFSQLAGKKIIVVNVASDCGYTGQYEQLETLYRRYKDRLIILGFPANDFKGQEPGSEEHIFSFCKINYGVSFPLFQKSSVLQPLQNEIYMWLSDAGKNGWNNIEPIWNFSKYLIDEHGRLVAFFPPAVSPLNREVVSRL
jgi:glutathione peroxidase